MMGGISIGPLLRASARRKRHARRDAYFARHLDALLALSREEVCALASCGPWVQTRAALSAALFRATVGGAGRYTAREASHACRLAQVCHLFGINDGELLLLLGEYAHAHGLPEAEEYYRTALLERPAPLGVITLPAHLSRYLPLAKDPLSVLSHLRDAFRTQGEDTVCRLGFLTYRMLWLPAVSHGDLDEAIGVARGLLARGMTEARESLGKLLYRKADLCLSEGDTAHAAALREEAASLGVDPARWITQGNRDL